MLTLLSVRPRTVPARPRRARIRSQFNPWPRAAINWCEEVAPIMALVPPGQGQHSVTAAWPDSNRSSEGSRMSTPTTEVHNATQPQELPAGGAVTKQLIVQKFGGSSVADAHGIKTVA